MPAKKGNTIGDRLMNRGTAASRAKEQESANKRASILISKEKNAEKPLMHFGKKTPTGGQSTPKQEARTMAEKKKRVVQQQQQTPKSTPMKKKSTNTSHTGSDKELRGAFYYQDEYGNSNYSQEYYPDEYYQEGYYEHDYHMDEDDLYAREVMMATGNFAPDDAMYVDDDGYFYYEQPQYENAPMSKLPRPNSNAGVRRAQPLRATSSMAGMAPQRSAAVMDYHGGYNRSSSSMARYQLTPRVTPSPMYDDHMQQPVRIRPNSSMGGTTMRTPSRQQQPSLGVTSHGLRKSNSSQALRVTAADHAMGRSSTLD
jgi:hypothetical protein